jgi:hypothetical protein
VVLTTHLETRIAVATTLRIDLGAS